MPLNHIQRIIRNILEILRGTMAWIKENYRYYQKRDDTHRPYKTHPKVSSRPMGYFYRQNRSREHHSVQAQRTVVYYPSSSRGNQR